MAQRLPRWTNTTHTDALKLDKIIGTTTTTETITVHTKATLPGDTRRLRGIPVVGGIGGTSPGTDPLGALLHKENLKDQRRKP